MSRYVIAHDQFTRSSPAGNGVRRPGYEAIVSTYSRGNHSNSDPQARRLILSWGGGFFSSEGGPLIYIIDSEFCVIYWRCNNT